MAEKVHISKEDFELLEGQSMFIADQKNALTKAKRGGLEEGIEKGIEKGMKKGEKKKALEIAKNLLDVLDNKTIVLKTGLTEEEIKDLRNL